LAGAQKARTTVRKQYAMTFGTGLGKTMTGAARRQAMIEISRGSRAAACG
jgi:hypothetical protein